MESLKALFNGFRKPQQRASQQQTEQPRVLRSERQLPKPVPPSRQPIRRLVIGVPVNRSTKSPALAIRKRRTVVPAKRTAELDQQPDAVPAKRARFQEESSPQVFVCDEDGGVGAQRQIPLEPQKRRRASSTSDKASPIKKAKSIVLDEADLADASKVGQAQTGVSSGVKGLITPEVSQQGGGDEAFSQYIPVSQDSVHSTDLPTARDTGVELGSLILTQKAKLSGSLHAKAENYVRSKGLAENQGRLSTGDGLSGIGLWCGSGDIPGCYKRSASDAAIIELPAEKPQQVAQNNVVVNEGSRIRARRACVTPMEIPKLFEQSSKEREAFTTANERQQKPKKAAASSKQQMRLPRLWDRTVGESMGPTKWTG